MKTIFLFLSCILLFSCSDDNISLLNSVNNKEDNYYLTNGISIHNGYLQFKDDKVLEEYLRLSEDNLDYSENSLSRSKESARYTELVGFTSLSKMRNSLNISLNSNIMSQYSKKNILSLSQRSEDEDEEMTDDEIRIARAEELLLDPILAEVVDTTLRIGVADRVYKITEYGTFSALTSDEQFIEQAIADFDISLIENTKLGTYINLANNVTFINSFKSEDSENQIEEISTIKTPTSSSVYENNLHNAYNVDTYRWRNNSVWQKFWDKLRGKDVSKENYFWRKRRVQVSVFNTNYGFYASSGIKVKMQKRKRVGFIKWWVSTDADKFAIGFNKVYGEMKYSYPRPLSNINQKISQGWSNFTSHINGIGSRFLIGQYKKFDLIKDWVDDIYMIIPQVEILNGVYPQKDDMNNLYMAPIDQVLNFLKGQVNRTVYTPIEKRIQHKDPRISYFPWSNSTTTYDKSRSYIMGVKEYGRRSSKSVRFDRSFGFSFNNGNVGGFVPTEFKIKSLDIFGAVYYDDEWRGVRFID